MKLHKKSTECIDLFVYKFISDFFFLLFTKLCKIHKTFFVKYMKQTLQSVFIYLFVCFCFYLFIVLIDCLFKTVFFVYCLKNCEKCTKNCLWKTQYLFIYLFIHLLYLLKTFWKTQNKPYKMYLFIIYHSLFIFFFFSFFLYLKQIFFYCLKHFANYTKLCFCEIHKTNPAKSICLFTYLFVYHMRATCASSETREVSRLQFFWLLFTLHLRAG